MRGNVSGRKRQNSVEEIRRSCDATLHRGDPPARPLNLARITRGMLAHATRTCGSTRTSPCRTASSCSPRSSKHPLGRPWGVWDGAALQIAPPIISSASPAIGRRALLGTSRHNDNCNPNLHPNRNRNSSLNRNSSPNSSPNSPNSSPNSPNSSPSPSPSPGRSPGIYAVVAPAQVGTSTTTRTSLVRGSTRPSLLAARTRPMWLIRCAAS